MLRRVLFFAVFVAGGAGAALACASLVGVGDLSCVADAAPMSLDPCVAESGVATVPMSGELHGLAYADGSLVAVGYQQGATPSFAIMVFSATGQPLADAQVGPSGTANAVYVVNDTAWVAGGDDASFMLRLYSVESLTPDPRSNVFPSTRFDTTNTPLREAVAIDRAKAGNLALDTLFGTTADGRLAALRINTTQIQQFSINNDVLYDASIPLRATDGVEVAYDGGDTLTILGDTPDAALGLAMARWTVHASPPYLPLDDTFGDGGAIIARFADGGSARTVVSAPGDVTYWVGGQDINASGFVVAHVDWSGKLDRVFVTSGQNRGINAMLWIDGGLLAAGFDDGKLALTRFTFDAGVDTTFGEGGVLNLGIAGELRTIVETDDHYVAGGFANVAGDKRWVLVWLTK